jgi:uncharacterized protein (DUF433 family)
MRLTVEDAATALAGYSLDMATQIATHIELRMNRDGQNRAYITGTRIRVQDIYALSELQGLDAGRIVEQLPQLSLGQVHAALSYYFDHRDEIMDEIRQDRKFADLMRPRTGPGPLETLLGGGARRCDGAILRSPLRY